MNEARRQFLAARVAPLREVVHVDSRSDGQTVRLICGHKVEVVPHCTVTADPVCCHVCGYDRVPELYPEEFGEGR